MAANNLEHVDALLLALGACKEGTDGRAISREVVALSRFEVPLLSLFDFSETVVGEQALAVVDCVEVTCCRIQANQDLARVLTSFCQESLGDL